MKKCYFYLGTKMAKKFLLISFSIITSCFAGKKQSSPENRQQYQQEFELRFCKELDTKAKKLAKKMADELDCNQEEKTIFKNRIEPLLKFEIHRLSHSEDDAPEEDISEFIHKANNFHQLRMNESEVRFLQNLLNKALSDYSSDSDSSQENR